MEEKIMGNEMKKVGFPAKFSIGFGVFGQSLLTGIATSYILYFCTDILAVSAMAISNILLISKLFDGVTDLGMGVVIDKTKSKKGKARPWIARAVVPYALFSILLFAVPQSFGNGMKLVWIFVAYNLYALAYTALGISMNTLNIRLTKDEKEVNSISTVLMFGTIFGNVVINAIAVGALTALSGSDSFTQAGFIKLTAILAVVCTIGGFASYATTTEIPDEETKQAEEKPSSMEGIKSLIKNKYWLMQVANTFFIYFGLNARLAAMVYYGIYVLGNPGLITALVIADNIPGLLAMPIALKICNKVGKRKTSLIGLCCTMIGFALMFLNIYNFPLFIAGLIIKGLFFAPVQGVGNSFIVDSAVYGEWKTGVKAEGMAFSAVSFANKVSSGLAGVVVGWVLTLTGYVANAAQQTPAATNGIIFLYIGVTFICTIGQIIVFACYDLDGKIGDIRKELEKRNNK